MYNFTSRLLGFLYELRVRWLEKRIGYRVEFNFIPRVWIGGVVRFNMGPSWQQHGIRAIGVNHWTIGSLATNGVSTRYDREQKQYQSWLGAYLVKFKENREFTIQDHFNLAVADQLNWLKDFGDPHPFYEMHADHIQSTEPFRLGEYDGMLYAFSGGPSHSDVGSSSWISRHLMREAAMCFNASNPSLNIMHENLVPKNIFSEYEMVSLGGYIAVVKVSDATYVVLYGNGAALLDEKGSAGKDYTPLLKDDILSAFKAVEIRKV